MNLNKKHLIIIGVIAVLVIGFLLYANFSEPTFDDGSALTAVDPTVDPVAAGESVALSNDLIQSEAFVVLQFTQLQSITLNNLSIMESPEFLALQDNTVVIPSMPQGRDNPFAPLGSSTVINNPDPFVEPLPELTE